MLSVAPGGRQLVRVIRTGQEAAVAGEQTFASSSTSSRSKRETKQAGVQYVLRYSVPVFVGVGGTPSLQWSSTSATMRSSSASATRRAHAQISDSTSCQPGAAPVEIVPGLLGYVLPGATMHWTIALPAGAKRGQRKHQGPGQWRTDRPDALAWRAVSLAACSSARRCVKASPTRPRRTAATLTSIGTTAIDVIADTGGARVRAKCCIWKS